MVEAVKKKRLVNSAGIGGVDRFVRAVNLVSFSGPEGLHQLKEIDLELLTCSTLNFLKSFPIGICYRSNSLAIESRYLDGCYFMIDFSKIWLETGQN